VVDFSKEYKPESKVVLDIPTALAFFLRDPELTKKLVGEKIARLVTRWNDTYETGEPEVKKSIFLWVKFI
jgi:hypothetical protein